MLSQEEVIPEVYLGICAY